MRRFHSLTRSLPICLGWLSRFSSSLFTALSKVKATTRKKNSDTHSPVAMENEQINLQVLCKPSGKYPVLGQLLPHIQFLSCIWNFVCVIFETTLYDYFLKPVNMWTNLCYIYCKYLPVLEDTAHISFAIFRASSSTSR